MGELKKKKSESNEKVEHQDSVKVEKKKPIKAGWDTRDNVGGIFISKVIAIMEKIKENKNGKILSKNDYRNSYDISDNSLSDCSTI